MNVQLHEFSAAAPFHGAFGKQSFPLRHGDVPMDLRIIFRLVFVGLTDFVTGLKKSK